MTPNYDEYGHVVLEGTFAVDHVTRGSHFSIHIGEERVYLQPVRFYRTNAAQVDHFSPRLTINILSRTFIHNSLLHEKKLAVECTGTHLGSLTLETHWQSSLDNVQQPTSPFRARMHFCGDGIEMFLDGRLLPPPYIPETSRDDGRPMPKTWPTHFQVDTRIPWEVIPFLLGHPGDYHRIRQRMFNAPTQA